MSLTGTPDWQRGVVTAQQKLGDFGPGAAAPTIALPPSCESLVILFHGGVSWNVVSVVGVTSGVKYPVFPYGVNLSAGSAPMWVSPVAPSEDSSVVVTVTGAGAPAWTAYSDMGIRVVADSMVAAVLGYEGGLLPPAGLEVLGSDGVDARHLRTDTNGQQFVVAGPPGIGTGDHPPNDIQLTAWNGSAYTTTPAPIVSAPGAGKRLRFFGLSASLYGTVANGLQINLTGIGGFLFGYQNAPVSHDFTTPPSGVPLAANTAITIQAVGATIGSMGFALTTTETI